MISKNEIKYIQSLKQKKFRYSSKQFTLEGNKIAKECIESRPELIVKVYALDPWIKTNDDILVNINEKLIPVSQNELDRISFLKTANSAVVLMQMPDISHEYDNSKWAFYLDRVQDPSNAGALYRVAEWFGIEQMITSEDSVDIYNPKVVQATMGSMLRLTTFTKSRDWLLEQENVLVADGSGKDIRLFQAPDRGILVLGNEGRGVSEVLLNADISKISIPRMSDRAYPESLNVSVAAGIICGQIML